RFLPRIFRTFSPERLFTALDSNITEVLFFVPGTPIPATVDGFGAVFTDVDRDNITKIEYFDINGSLLFSRFVLPGTTQRQSLSFLGVRFDAGERVFCVKPHVRSQSCVPLILRMPHLDRGTKNQQ